MSDFSDGDGDVGRHVDLSVFAVVDTEAEVVLAISRSMAHSQHASVLVEREIRMLLRVPVEFLVRQIPIIEIVDVNSTDFCIWRLALLQNVNIQIKSAGI